MSDDLFIDLNEFVDVLGLVEEKAAGVPRPGLRRMRVRTAAGAAKYGEPIGALILVNSQGTRFDEDGKPMKTPDAKAPAKAPAKRPAASAPAAAKKTPAKRPAAATAPEGDGLEEEPPPPPLKRGQAPNLTLPQPYTYKFDGKTVVAYDITAEDYPDVPGMADFGVAKDEGGWYAHMQDDDESETDGNRYKTPAAALKALQVWMSQNGVGGKKAPAKRTAATRARTAATKKTPAKKTPAKKAPAPRKGVSTGRGPTAKQREKSEHIAAVAEAVRKKTVVKGASIGKGGNLFRGTKLQDPPPPYTRKKGEDKGLRPPKPGEIERLMKEWGVAAPSATADEVLVNPLALQGVDDGLLFVIKTKLTKNYVYTPHHEQRVKAAKWDEAGNLGSRMPELEKKVQADAMKDGNEGAAMIALMMTLGMRPDSSGKSKSQKGHDAFGTSSLEARHVIKRGGKMYLKFAPGKHQGQEIEIPVENDLAIKVIQKYVAGKKSNERLFSRPASDANAYLKEALPGADFEVRRLRTVAGTALALKFLDEEGKRRKTPLDPANMTRVERQALLKAMLKYVSDHLGNSPTVAKTSYIDPDVLKDLL